MGAGTGDYVYKAYYIQLSLPSGLDDHEHMNLTFS